MRVFAEKNRRFEGFELKGEGSEIGEVGEFIYIYRMRRDG